MNLTAFRVKSQYCCKCASEPSIYFSVSNCSHDRDLTQKKDSLVKTLRWATVSKIKTGAKYIHDVTPNWIILEDHRVQ